MRAGNDHGWSGWRNSSPAGPYTPPSPPGSVASVTVTRADGSLTASWDAVDGATKHHVTYTSDNGASWSLAALEHPSNSITVTGLANSATYIVGVRAGNGGGWSGWVNSPASGPYTPPTPEPTPEPTPDPNAGIIVQDADGNAVTALSVPEGGETSYQIKLASQPTQDVEVCIGLSVRDNDDSDITFKGEASDVVSIKLSFTPGNWDTAQTVTLVAAEDNDYANGARDVTHDAREYYSGKVDWTATEIDNDEITVTATRGDDGDTASVSWNAYIADDFSYYRVIVCTDAQYDGASCSGTLHKSEPIYNVNSTGPVTVPDLDPGTGTGIILQVWRNSGALKSHDTLPAGPAAPSGLTVTSSDGSLTVSWDAVSGATGYDVRSSADGSSWTTEHSNVSGTSVSVADANGEIEQIGVRAQRRRPERLDDEATDASR